MLQSLPLRPPVIVHHMGAMDDSPHPPNSIEAICACLDARAAFIEIDATALADADYLLVHDPLLESETTGRGEVGACTSAQARGLCYVVDGQPTNARVSLLSEVVAAFLQHGSPSRLQIDFKNMMPFANDEPLQRFIKLIEPLGERVIVSSGADWQLRRLRTLAPWLDLGLDIHFYIDWLADPTQRDPHEYPKTLGAYGYWDDHPLAMRRIWPTADYLRDKCQMLIGLVPSASTFYVEHKFLVQSLRDGFNWADELHMNGIKLDAWTMDVTNPVAVANAPMLLQASVDQFTTNTPVGLAASINAPERNAD